MICSCAEKIKSVTGCGVKMLYKYCSVDTAKKILGDGAVLLGAAINLNDPFEMNCRLKWPANAELRKRIARRVSDPNMMAILYEDALDNKREFGRMLSPKTRQIMLNSVGVSCFSETRESILMWSHYADEHKGVCVGFSADALARSLQTESVIGGFAYMCRVKYKNALPVWSVGDPDIRDVVATKARCWAYEKEWRILSPYAAGEKQKALPESFGEVIFGAKILESDRERLTQLIAERHLSVKLLNAEISRGKYKVEFSDCTPPRE